MASPVDDDVIISSAVISDSGGSINLANGFGLTVDGSLFNLGGGAGFLGQTGAGTATVNVINSSSIIAQFFATGIVINVDGTSLFQVNGGGDPINSQTKQTTLNLAVGGRVRFSNTAELADQLDDTGTGDIYVNGTRVTGANQATLLSTSDNLTYTALAIPEPSSTALLGLGSIALLLRRSKK